MLERRALLAGALVSLLMHLWLVLSPGWGVPEETSRPLPLSARLLAAPSAVAMPAPAPAAAPPAVSRPAPPPKPRPAQPPRPNATTASLPATQPPPAPEPASAPAAVPASAPVAADTLAGSAQVAGPPVQASAPEPLPVPAGTEQFMAAPGDLRWPNKGRVTYVASVLWGILPLEGSGEQRWEHDGEGFRVRQVVGGLGREIVQESAGRILRGQPIIDGFRETRTNGRSAQALIDQANGSILQIRGEERRERKVEGAILDLVTLPHMLAAVGAQIDVVEFNAIGGFWVERVVVANEGEVEIELPLGRVMARRFHAETRQGQYKIDIWISRDWRGAPLRIRVDDRREGLRVDMRATEIELDGQIVASTPAPDRLRE